MKKLFIIQLIFLMLFVSCSADKPQDKIVKTINEQQIDIQESWNSNTKRITIFDTYIEIVPIEKKTLMFKDLKKLTLKLNDTYKSINRHWIVEYKLVKIEPNKVTMEYMNEFDHNSFGKRLITIDTGSIILKGK